MFLHFRTIASLDYETFPEFVFRVHVRDGGQPPQTADSPADVVIKVDHCLIHHFNSSCITLLISLSGASQVINTNDSPPRFSQDTYETVLLLPTYMGVEVLRVEAFDPDATSDKSVTPVLVYSLVDKDVEHFSVQRNTGVVTVINPNLNKDRYRFNVKVK